MRRLSRRKDATPIRCVSGFDPRPSASHGEGDGSIVHPPVKSCLLTIAQLIGGILYLCPSLETGMALQCFRIENSPTHPVCGVHNVPLIEHQSSEYSVLSKFGDFPFFVCPVSGYVVLDSPPQKRSPD